MQRQIIECELFPICYTHKATELHKAGLESAFFSTGTDLAWRLYGDYCFRRQGESSVERPAQALAFLLPQLKTLLLGLVHFWQTRDFN